MSDAEDSDLMVSLLRSYPQESRLLLLMLMRTASPPSPFVTQGGIKFIAKDD